MILRLVLILSLILTGSITPVHASILDTIRETAEQSSLLARNAASKILEKANEYGYDDLDILVRFGMGIKYPEGIEVRPLDASLALLDLSLTATDKGINYVNFLFRHRVGRWIIQYIPYLTGRSSLTNLLLRNLQQQIRNYLENYQFGAFLALPSRPGNDHLPVASVQTDPVDLPRLPFDVRSVRLSIREMQRGIKYFNDDLSNDFLARVVAGFPEISRNIPAQLLTDLTSGQILLTIVELLAKNREEFLRIGQELTGGAEFIKACRTATDDVHSRILLGIPRDIKSMLEFSEFMERLPEAIPLVARHGVNYYQLIRTATPAQFERVRSLGEHLSAIPVTYGNAGLRFLFRYGNDGAELLFFMQRPSSYMKRRLRMASFFVHNGVGSFPWFFRLKLLSPLEPILLGTLFLLFLFVVIYFHISGYLVWSVFIALPMRQKVAVFLILFLFSASFYWTLVENARLLIEGDATPRPVVYHKTPRIALEPGGLFSTSIHAIESAEVEFNRLISEGANFRTAEAQIFKQNLSNLHASFTAVLESFEVRLISEPKLYENYNNEKILSEEDLLLDLTVSIRNLDNQPRLFPLTIELSSVMGNLISPIQGHQRLMKTTFNPDVRDIFTLSFPIRLEDRPDRMVIKKEFLLNTREKFIAFGPGTPLRIGDILPTRSGLVCFKELHNVDTRSVELSLSVLSSFDTTRETSLFQADQNHGGIFVVLESEKILAPQTIQGNWENFPSLLPNRLLTARLKFTAEISLRSDQIRYIVLNNKKLLAEKYTSAEEVNRITTQYLQRIAAASEFDLGMYYLNPPIYRRWARDVDEARQHFERAQELLPDFPLIRDALHLTGRSMALPVDHDKKEIPEGASGIAVPENSGKEKKPNVR